MDVGQILNFKILFIHYELWIMTLNLNSWELIFLVRRNSQEVSMGFAGNPGYRAEVRYSFILNIKKS